jgi:peptidoglycan/xylan/chitin deacetylase (PgdA/CDA1 family)
MGAENFRPHLIRSDRRQVRMAERMFRPPYGACNDVVRTVANELNYRIVLWTADTKDWKPENRFTWVDLAIQQIAAQRLAICLCHDSDHTAEHLPRLIEE